VHGLDEQGNALGLGRHRAILTGNLISGNLFVVAKIHVIVVGGGIGGLCLAQGLRKAGIDVAVFEKGPKRGDPRWSQGFQIHINPAGARALEECLEPSLWSYLVANACEPAEGLQVLTEQMREIISVDGAFTADKSSLPIVRSTLRRILLEGLGDVVHFGKSFVRYQQNLDGTVEAFFDDGTSVTADVLVGADGTGSRVRSQHLPHATISDTGIVGASARLTLDAATREHIPVTFLSRLTSILPPRDSYMIVTRSIHQADRDERDGDAPDHLIWVWASSRRRYGTVDPRDLDGATIKQRVLDGIGSWHSALRSLVESTPSDAVVAHPILTSDAIERWKPSRVTLLGDAIHTMTPFQGLGGSTALRDAGLLCHKLTEIQQDRSTFTTAIDEYESAMVNYGFAAVRRSARFGDRVVLSPAAGRAFFKTMMRIVNAIPPLKRRMIARVGARASAAAGT
jgi:2-polyprenyl-6-methoxyphenol hydroxylase-like FAD-dependent oxidoreductase